MIDHLVYTVPQLEAALDDLETRLGVRPVMGGYHDTRGTKNALVKLDQGIYLEILAADDTNTAVAPPRWMGVDLLTGAKLTRWAMKPDDLPAAATLLCGHDPLMGEIVAGSRKVAGGGELRWRMTLPLAGPEVEVVPFLIDWSETEELPYDGLPEMGCGLVKLVVVHPNPEVIGPLLARLGAEVVVEEGAEVKLRAVLRCPNGTLEI